MPRIKQTDILQLVVFSDLHCGSRRALMPREYDLYEEGQLRQTVKANKQQLWLLECWEKAWEDVLNYVSPDPWAWAFVGDAIEGLHHRRSELVSTNVTDHMIIFDMMNRPVAEQAAKRYFVRGTSVHVSDTDEMKLAEKLECERHPDTGQYAADRWLLSVRGYPFILKHHIGVTSREWLRVGELNRDLDNEILAASKRGHVAPKGAVLAHRHLHDEYISGDNFVVVCGPWQQTTRHGHTKWSAMVPQPTVTVLDWRESRKGGPPEVKTFQYTPPAPKVEKI